MTDQPAAETHLAHIRQQVAMLVARLEEAASAGGGAATEPAAALARLLLRRITFTEQALQNDRESAEAMRRIDHVYRDSIGRIDALQDDLERTPRAQRPDLDQPPPSTGSNIGDAVRDSFMNLG